MTGDWTGLLIGVGTMLVGVAAVLHAELQRRRRAQEQRVRRATDLHQLYYSESFFSRVALPVGVIARRWELLPAPQRESYRQAVLLGWVGYDSAESLAAMSGERPLDDDSTAAHFIPRPAGETLSEHDSLVLCLYFWTRVSLLADLKLLDDAVARQLFAWPYSYLSTFFGRLSAAILTNLGPHERPPQWIDAVAHLDSWLLPPPRFRHTAEANGRG